MACCLTDPFGVWGRDGARGALLLEMAFQPQICLLAAERMRWSCPTSHGQCCSLASDVWGPVDGQIFLEGIFGHPQRAGSWHAPAYEGGQGGNGSSTALQALIPSLSCCQVLGGE